MNSVQKIRKRLFKQTTGIITVVLLALTAFFLIMGLVVGLNDRREPIQFEAIDHKVDDYCFVDVVSLDPDWVAETNTEKYYTVYDEHYIYIAILKDSEVNKMSSQISYFNKEVALSEAYRIVGNAKRIPSDLKRIYMDAYNISSEEFDGYFGDYYLDCKTVSVLDDSSLAYMWFLFALFSGLFALVFAAVYLPAKKSMDGCMKLLAENSALDLCAEELDKMGKKDKILVGENYLYSTSNPMVIAYKDVLWAYIRTTRVNGIKTGSSLVLNPVFGKELIVVTNSQDTIDEILDKVYQANPETLIGYTNENGKKYKELVKQYKNK